MFSPFEIMVAGRYLRARKAEGFVSVIAAFSFAGIMLGVATLIIVMSVMNGYRAEMFNLILGFNGHLNVYSESGPLIDYGPLTARIAQVPGVISAVPLVESQALISANGFATGVMVRGLSAQSFAHTRLLATSIKAGRLTDFSGDGVAIGTELAANAHLRVGDRINLIGPKGRTTPFGTMPRTASYRIAMIFDVGMSQYDSGFLFMPIDTAQGFFQMPGGVSAIQVMTRDPDDLDAVRTALESALHGEANISDWRDINSDFFGALQVEQNVMFLILTLIIVVAAFNIISSMIMLVKDKGHDIAIMRTMGATRANMLHIFMLAGASIGFIGTGVGALAGIAFALNIEAIRQWLQRLTGVNLFNSTVYFLSHLPAKIEWAQVIATIAVAFLLSILATLYPAWRAARLDPVEALRYE